MGKLFVAISLHNCVSPLFSSIKLLKVGIVYNEESFFFKKKLSNRRPFSQNLIAEFCYKINRKKWAKKVAMMPPPPPLQQTHSILYHIYIHHTENLPVWYNLMQSKKFEMVYAFNTPVPTKYNTANMYITQCYSVLDGWKKERKRSIYMSEKFPLPPSASVIQSPLSLGSWTNAKPASTIDWMGINLFQLLLFFFVKVAQYETQSKWTNNTL